MNKNNEQTNITTEELAHELRGIAKEATLDGLRTLAEQAVVKALESHFKNDELSAEQIEDMIDQTVMNLRSAQISTAVQKSTFANVRSARYWADIAIRSVTGLAINGAVIGVGAYAYGRFKSAAADKNAAATTGEEAFSDKTPFAASPRPMRQPKGANVSSLSSAQTH